MHKQKKQHMSQRTGRTLLYAKYEYDLFTYDLIRRFSGIIAAIMAYNRTDQSRLHFIRERKLVLRRESVQLQKIDLMPYLRTLKILRMRHEYFRLVSEEQSILKRVSKLKIVGGLGASEVDGMIENASQDVQDQ